MQKCSLAQRHCVLQGHECHSQGFHDIVVLADKGGAIYERGKHKRLCSILCDTLSEGQTFPPPLHPTRDGPTNAAHTLQ